jgi:hypothetical protein
MKLPLSPLLLLAASTLASLSLACGGRTEALGSEPSPIAACAPPSPSTDAVDNCASYCNYLACNGCPGGAAACDALCRAVYTSGKLNEACLACAVADESGLAHSFTCESYSMLADDGGAVFALDFPLPACSDACATSSAHLRP